MDLASAGVRVGVVGPVSRELRAPGVVVGPPRGVDLEKGGGGCHYRPCITGGSF